MKHVLKSQTFCLNEVSLKDSSPTRKSLLIKTGNYNIMFHLPSPFISPGRELIRCQTKPTFSMVYRVKKKGLSKVVFLSFILLLYLNGKFRIKFPLDSNRNFINPTTEPVSPYRLIEQHNVSLPLSNYRQDGIFTYSRDLQYVSICLKSKQINIIL